MKIKQGNLLIIVFSATAFVLLVFACFLFLKIKETAADSSLVNGQIISAEKEFSEIENFRRRYEDYSPDLKKIDSLFVDANAPVEFIQFLEENARKSGVSLKISIPPVQGKKASNYTDFQLNIGGNLSGILDFIHKIENSTYLLEARNLSLKGAENKKDARPQELLQADLLLQAMTTYVY